MPKFDSSATFSKDIIWAFHGLSFHLLHNDNYQTFPLFTTILPYRAYKSFLLHARDTLGIGSFLNTLVASLFFTPLFLQPFMLLPLQFDSYCPAGLPEIY